jgi:hypothetical protein
VFVVQSSGANPYLGANQTPVRAQLLIRDASGTFFRPETPQDQPTFVDLSGTFLSASFTRPNTTPAQIRVRIFVPSAGQISGDTGAEVNIDRVCPKTAS